MTRGMIIGRLRPSVQKESIIKAFEESDATKLPHLIGVRTRSIFVLGDIYVHLVEAEMPLKEVIQVMKDHPLYVEVKKALDSYVEPLSPDLYPGIAEEIYSWSAETDPSDYAVRATRG